MFRFSSSFDILTMSWWWSSSDWKRTGFASHERWHERWHEGRGGEDPNRSEDSNESIKSSGGEDPRRGRPLYWKREQFDDDVVDGLGRKKKDAPWFRSDYVAGSSAGECGYNTQHGTYLQDSERLHVATPFKCSDLDFDWYKQWQRDALSDYGIKCGILPRHNHIQLDIIGFKGIDQRDMIVVLTQVIDRAQWIGYNLDDAEFRNSTAQV